MITKKISSLSFALMLIISIVAAAFMIGNEAKIVSAEDLSVDDIENIRLAQLLIYNGVDVQENVNFGTDITNSLKKAGMEPDSDGFYKKDMILHIDISKLSSLTGVSGDVISESYDAKFMELNQGACLTPETQISLANLQTKPISEIKIGDEVLSYDFTTKELTKEIVRNVIVSTKYSYLKINDILEITPNHEVLLNGEWQEVGNAKIGDYFLGIDEENILIKDIELVKKPEGIDVYDLDLGGSWYFAEGVLVHNSAAPGPSDAPVEEGGKDKNEPPAPGDRSDSSYFLGGKVNLSLFKYGMAGHLFEGVAWGLAVNGIIRTFGGIFFLDKSNDVEAVANAATMGVLAFKGMQQLFSTEARKEGWFLQSEANKGSWYGKFLSNQWTQIGVGVGVAWLMYNHQHKKYSEEEDFISFDCMPWQAPRGGLDCELCNDKTGIPCSEYRCKSLGQSCGIINKGTDHEMCVNLFINDASPPVIKPLDSALTNNYYYADVREMPPGAGFTINSQLTSTGCIPPFTSIQFGIETDEPAQCKIDIEPKGNYSKMATYFGGSNLYSYNHTETLSVPSAETLNGSSLMLQNGKELNFYIRCIDGNGNANEADYGVKICVDPTPDSSAPQVLGTSISDGSCVASDRDNSTVEFYLNEPSECRWDFVDLDYSQMKNNMSCSSIGRDMNALRVYPCVTTLTGVKRDGTNFYVRCKDQPGNIVNESKRNVNTQSYEFALRGSERLLLKNVKPNTTIYGAVSPAQVELYAETTFGCNDKQAICFYSPTGINSSYVQFFDTNKNDGIHTQRLDLYSGTYNYFIKCIDSGGNIAEGQTEFTVDIDPDAPIIARIYEENDYLNIETVYDSDCAYTNTNCDFIFVEGAMMPYAQSTIHRVPWEKDKNYYIKCRDEYRQESIDCSMIIRPTDNFL